MWPTDCHPGWIYEQHPQRAQLASRVASLLLQLRTTGYDCTSLLCDSRPFHEQLFAGLTPPSAPYYAGHYRGESFHCLEEYPVGVAGDPRVGAPPQLVLSLMANVARQVQQYLPVADALWKEPETSVSSARKLEATVTMAATVFEYFLRVHPYANGNGHIARLRVWAILGRYGFWPRGWPVEPRTADPAYASRIMAFRSGNQGPLVQFFLGVLVAY